MGKKDAITKEYMNDPCIFADAFNYFMYDGRQIILPEQLHSLDAAEIVIPYMTDGKIHPVQKFRDNLKYLAAMQYDHTTYLLLGMENQSEIHYAMPVKVMVYDSLQYASQVDAAGRRYRRHLKSGEKEGIKISPGEFLSGFRRYEKLFPVITLVIYFEPEKWDAPMGLHDMMGIKNQVMLSFVPDYRINLISPYSIPDSKLDQFHTSLREVLLFIKHSKDKNRLRDIVTTDPHFLSMDQKAGQVIKILTGSDFEIREEEETINMCKALEDLKEEWQQEGFQEGLTGAIFSLLSELGEVPNAIRVQICEEKSMEFLNLYLKKAAAAKTLDDFCVAIK